MNGLPARTIDTVVVGAGPGGLAASAALTDRGVGHVVLERGRVGQTWRDQRWDSLRLNNPGWMNPMLGPQPADTYLTAREVLSRLDAMSGSCPVREFTPVTQLDAVATHLDAGRGLVVKSGPAPALSASAMLARHVDPGCGGPSRKRWG